MDLLSSDDCEGRAPLLMNLLDKTLRNKLENTITRAREIAEEAAKTAIEQLGVEQPNPYSYLTAEQKELRRKLRAHGRHLGDERDPKIEKQDIERLTDEVAYQHWHRMLFARFLAENQLLMFYEDDVIGNAVAVSLEECVEMAPDMGYRNGWDLAARLAAKMLPQIFRPESPVFEFQFSPEKQKELEFLLSKLENEVFTASDSLGWVYQFWQSKEKESVNNSEVKIGAKELPTVTQLFTEPYMVNFLLDNSLGAWWAEKRLSKDDLMVSESEDELRNKSSLPGLPLEYLRFIKGENSKWSPAGGSFEDWPDQLSELKALDPCCGSGHFLVAAFLMLVPMRMELEGLSAREACDEVLKDNIHGLEIDERCVELAAFAVALTAWKYPHAGGFRQLPDLQIAWCGQTVNVKREEWLALADGDSTLEMHLEGLSNLFENAPTLGSLLNPRDSLESSGIFSKNWESINERLQASIMKKKHINSGIGIIAQGIEKAFQIIGDKYQWVLTNVPYLSWKKQSEIIKEYAVSHYKDAKNELATVFLQRCLEYCAPNGMATLVLPQNWLFLWSYKNLRHALLRKNKFNMVVKLGTNAFQTPMYDYNIQLLSINLKLTSENNCFTGIDVSNEKEAHAKAIGLTKNSLIQLEQKQMLRNPDYRINFDSIEIDTSLNDYIFVPQGIKTGDDNKFRFYFWELDQDKFWKYYQSTPDSYSKSHFTGYQYKLRWENCGSDMTRSRPGNTALGKKGIAVSQMNTLPWSFYSGELYDSNINVVVPRNEKNFLAITAYITSQEFRAEIRKIDQKLSVTNGTFTKVPFDLNYWSERATEMYPQGVEKPYSNDPEQWIFHGYPAHTEAPLQVAVARLLGYRWPAEIDTNMELSNEAKELVKRCDDLLPFADKDGIVCIPPVRGEAAASERLLNLLAAAYRGQDINPILSKLLASSDHAGKSLDSWLREKFFNQHVKMFGHRPFIWHIWDGLSDGFSALVNYHKLDTKNLETLTYTYLGDWINKQKEQIAAGVDGTEEKLAAAESLKKSLELILEGEDPYDIFIRWKPMQLQPIGWEPDINDGVRMNIRPFMSVPDVGKKGAGILRDKPNIRWDKDRGKDTELSPWYHLFKGDRINDHHLSLNEKKSAREEKR